MELTVQIKSKQSPLFSKEGAFIPNVKGAKSCI